MIKVMCVNKVRNNRGNIKSYILKDDKGICREMSPTELKEKITSESIEVVNLQIDKAGRLIDKTYKNPNVAINENKHAKVLKDYWNYMNKNHKKDDFYSLKEEEPEGKVYTNPFGSFYMNWNEPTYKTCLGSMRIENGYPHIIGDAEHQQAVDLLNDNFARLNNFLNSGRKLKVLQLWWGTFFVTFPNIVEERIKDIEHQSTLRKSMFMAFSKCKDYAYICYNYQIDDGIVDEMILTHKYKDIKKFLQEKVEEQAENEATTFIEALNNIHIAETNPLGEAFVYKFIADSLGYTKSDIAIKIIQLAIQYQKENANLDIRECIEQILINGTEHEEAYQIYDARHNIFSFNSDNLARYYLAIIAFDNRHSWEHDHLSEHDKAKLAAYKLYLWACKLNRDTIN